MVLSRSAILALLLSFTEASLPSAQPSFAIRRPTVIAFFPPVTQKELVRDPETNESLADFQLYVQHAREPLAQMGIDLKEVYARSFRTNVGGNISTFRVGDVDVGYYFVAPGKKPRIEYGVETDSDLVQLSNEYFRKQSRADEQPAVSQVCEVLKHQDEYIGQGFTFRGVVTQYEHGMYFVPYPDCAEHEAGKVHDFPRAAYVRFGGGKGVGVLATVDIEIVVRPTAPSVQNRGGPGKQAVLSVRRAYDLERAPVAHR